MRSLYVDDIPGAKPTRHAHEKSQFYRRHQQEVVRFGNRDPQAKRDIAWYSPQKKAIEPIDRQNYLLKPLGGTLCWTPTPRLLPCNPQHQLSKSSILANSASSSLHNHPYFPHRYDQASKWSGNRIWQDKEPTNIIIPNVSSQYIAKWT